MDVSEEPAAAFHSCPPKYWHLYSILYGFSPYEMLKDVRTSPLTKLRRLFLCI